MNDNQMRKGLATVFGGSGFIGRHVVRALICDGWRVRVACRRPHLAIQLKSFGEPGQIELTQANLRDAQTIAAALKGADAAVNLVGILAESENQTFADIQSRGARSVAEAVKEAGITRFVHISAIGAREDSPSGYARSKAEGEAAVHELVPQAIILRPSIVFGPEDDFFNRFAGYGPAYAGSAAGRRKHTVPAGFRGRHRAFGSARTAWQGDHWRNIRTGRTRGENFSRTGSVCL